MKKTLLGEYLVAKGKLDRTSLDIALQEQIVTGEKLGQILVRFGLVGNSDLDEVLLDLNPELITGENSRSSKLSVEFLLRTKTMVIGDPESVIFLATLNDDPVGVKRQAELICGKRVELRPVPHNEILAYLAEIGRGEESYKRPLSAEDDINVVIDAILLEAHDMRASDIHIETTEKSVRVRLRIDGMLYNTKTLALAQAGKLFGRFKGMSNMDESDSKRPQDGSFTKEISGRNVDYRVSTIPTVYGEKLEIRILDKERLLINLDELGLSQVEEYKKILNSPNGLILVTGTTGSGKSTTLYSSLLHLDRHQRNIITMEDPIEYKLEFITQCQVNDVVGFGFDQFPRTAMRQDPDVVLVGEIRDRQTAISTVHLAYTGHLVFSTLHNTNIRSTIARMESLGVPESSLANILRGILVLRLARKLCNTCTDGVHEGNVCPKCRGTGYYGRTLLSEFVKIEKPEDLQRIMSGTLKYHTFTDDAKLMVESGVTDWREIARISELAEAETLSLDQTAA